MRKGAFILGEFGVYSIGKTDGITSILRDQR